MTQFTLKKFNCETKKLEPEFPVKESNERAYKVFNEIEQEFLASPSLSLTEGYKPKNISLGFSTDIKECMLVILLEKRAEPKKPN